MTYTSEPAAASSGARGSQRLDPLVLDRLWDFSDPAGSEQRLREAIDRAPTDSTEHAELTTQLARALGLQDRFDDARALLDVVALRGYPDPVVDDDDDDDDPYSLYSKYVEEDDDEPATPSRRR